MNSRCVGIWAAVPAAIVLFAALRRWDAVLAKRPALTILLSLVPLGIDWTADFLGFWSNTMASRLVTGAIFGLVAGYFLARVIVRSVPDAKPATKELRGTNTSFEESVPDTSQ